MGPHHVAWLESGVATLSGTPLDLGQRTEVIGIVSLQVLSEGRVIAALADQVRAAGTPRSPRRSTPVPSTTTRRGTRCWTYGSSLDGVAALMESTRRVPVEE